MDGIDKSYRAVWDRLGITLSALCLVHCVATPLAAMVMPAFALGRLGGEWVHALFAGVLLPVAAAAFVPGFRRHRNRQVVSIATVGLALLVAGSGVDIGLDEGTATLLTVTAGALLILAHILNRTLCRRCDACRAPRAAAYS